MLKKLLLPVSIAAVALFIGCDDDSSSSGEPSVQITAPGAPLDSVYVNKNAGDTTINQKDAPLNDPSKNEIQPAPTKQDTTTVHSK
jgi:hypothetical protein